MPVTIALRPPEPEPEPEPITTVTVVDSLDTLMDSVACSCAAGDDNPH